MEYKIQSKFDIGDKVRGIRTKGFIGVIITVELIKPSQDYESWEIKYLIEFHNKERRWFNKLEVSMFELATED